MSGITISGNCTISGAQDTTGTSGSSGNQGGGVFRTGIMVLESGDFFQRAGVLHPIVIGSIALILSFAYIRKSSNRAVAPFSIWDKLLEVALGSTLAGIINGNSLVRGLLGLIVLFSFQRVTSSLSVRFPRYCGWILDKPSLIVVFRGEQLSGVMRKHRISQHDLNAALRLAGVWNICEVHLMCIETNGAFTVFRESDYPTDHEPTLLQAVPGYNALCDAPPRSASDAVKRVRAERQTVGFKALMRSSGSAKDGRHAARKEAPHCANDTQDDCKTPHERRDTEDEEEDIEGAQGTVVEKEGPAAAGEDDRKSVHSRSSIANNAAKQQEDHDKDKDKEDQSSGST